MHEELTSRRTTVIFVVLTVINLFLLTTHLNIYIRAAKNILWYLAHPTAASAERCDGNSGEDRPNAIR